MTLTGRGTHKQYHVGMPLKVTLTNANVEQHQLDFEIYDPNAPKKRHNSGGFKMKDVVIADFATIMPIRVTIATIFKKMAIIHT
ncbi:hypothetical protein SDC49_12380 [Lactobacillus sp. R2/2]|nr:hypothetical protein [Lactobacillus sp. R2/2]